MNHIVTLENLITTMHCHKQYLLTVSNGIRQIAGGEKLSLTGNKKSVPSFEITVAGE